MRGFRPSPAGLDYMAALLPFEPGRALVQAGTPTDVGIRRVKSFILDLESGNFRRVASQWPRVFDIRGDLVLVDAAAWFPQLAIHQRVAGTGG